MSFSLTMRQRFFILHISTIFIPLVLLGSTLISLSFISLEKRFQNEQSLLTLSVKENLIDRRLQEMELILNELASDEQLMNMDNEMINRVVLSKWSYTQRLFPYLSWIYFGRPDNSLSIVPFWEGDDYYDLTVRPWYVNALTTSKAVWTQPYYEYLHNDLVLSVSRKVMDRDGHFAGVMAIDIILNDLFSSLKVETRGVSRKHLIVTRKGRAINFNRRSSEPIEYTNILDWQTLIESGESWASAEIGSEKYYVFIIPIDHLLDMYMVSLLPSSEIMAEITPHLRFIAVLFILVMMVVILSNVMLSRYVFKRIRALTTTMDEVVKGNYNPEHRIRNNDEFRMIETQLHIMVQRLAGKIRELDVSNQQNEKLLALRTSLIHIFSHNATTPVTLLFNSTHELSQAGNDEEMEHLHLAASNLKSLIDNTMAFLKLDEGISPGRMNMMDLEEITRLTVNMYNPLARKKELTISLESTLEMPVTGNYFLIKIIIENLVDNAVKYSFSGGFISISLSHTEQEVHFLIQDSGPGFSADDIPHMFTRFRRLSAIPTGGEISTGLGLYLARELALYHKGDLKLIDTTGRGACFLLTFPL